MALVLSGAELSLVTFVLILAAGVLLGYEMFKSANPRAGGASLLAATVVLGACACAFWFANHLI
jgi:hypothetical protein